MTGFVPNWSAGIATLNPKDFGALGNGVHDDTSAIQSCFDAAFGPAASPNGNLNSTLNQAVCFPPGQYIITSAIVLNQVFGGHIFGSGARGSTLITLIGTNSATDNVVLTDGLEFSKIENISFGIASNQTVGTVFMMDRALNTTGVNIQSNTFVDCNFGSGSVGVWINKTNQPTSQGSENSFINCFFQGPPASSTFSGLRITGQNALMNCVWGGDMQAHQIGVDVPVGGGSCPIIHGVSFQSSGAAGTYDIKVLTSSPDDYSVVGCRSESPDFGWFQGGSGVNIENCTQTSGVGGTFLLCDGAATVSGCHVGGQFLGGNLTLDNCFFTSSTPWTGTGGTNGGIINRWHGPAPGFQQQQARWTFDNLPPATMCNGMRHYVFDSYSPISQGAAFSATISTTNLTASSVIGTIAIGQYIVSGAAAGTQITGQTSGTLGGAGVYTVSVSQTVGSSTPMVTGSNVGSVLAKSPTIASFTGSLNDGGSSAGTILTVSSGTGIAAGQLLRYAGGVPGLLILSGSGTNWATNFAGFAAGGTAMTTAAANTVPIYSDNTNWRLG